MNEEPTYEELKDKVRQLEKLLEKRTRQLSDELKASIRISADLEKRSFELNQRIIELKAVLEMTTLSDNPNLKLSDFYREVLKIVVASFQFPEITGAEMRVENEVVRTDNYRETAWKMGRGLMEGENMFGYLRVCYLESKPEKDFGPFTKEEKNLLVVLTRYLSQIIKRKQFEEKLDKFQQVISQSRSMIMITDKMECSLKRSV